MSEAAEGTRWTRMRWFLWVLAALLTTWSWRQWPDVQVDFGRELYVPWRLTQGDVLHRDLAWFNGPLSAWWNALWFKLAGTSLLTIVVVNLALLLLTLELITAGVRRWAGNLAALASGALFLCAFAFARHAPIGNYNFVTPYSHELTHGLVLSLSALALLSYGTRRRQTLLAGACLGLVFLTKAEVAFAAAGACAVRLFGAPVAGRRWLFGLGTLIPIALALGFLTYRLGSDLAPSALAGSWIHVGQSDLYELPFYRAILGSDDIAGNLRRMGLWAEGSSASFGLLYSLCARRSDGALRSPAALSLGALSGALILGLVLNEGRWLRCASALPLLVLGIIGHQWNTLRLARADSVEHRRAADALALCVLAFLLLGKMILNSQWVHYGFVLALPAAIVLAAYLVGTLPRLLTSRGKSGEFFQATCLGGVVMFLAFHLNDSHAWYHGQPAHWRAYDEVSVGAGTDEMHVRWRGKEVAAALADLEQRMGPDDTLLVLPEGVMLNYLLRRRTPTRHVNFMPPELLLWGEETILAELQDQPPDFVAIVHKDTSEYGVPRFGQDYGQLLWTWIENTYERKQVFGAIPMVSSRFGIAVMERR